MRCVLLLVAALTAAQDIPESPEQLKFKDLRFDLPDPEKLRAELPNGAVVFAVEDRTLPKVEVTVNLWAGSFWEDPGKEGLAKLMASLMRTGGTATRKPEELDEELDFLAANVSVDLGETGGSATLSVLSKDLDRGLEIFFDVLRRPAFAQEQLDLLKAQTLEQLKSRNDRIGSIESREANRLLYGDFPVNRLPTGASVAAITREDLVRYHARFFQPWNFYIAASGDFSREELVRKLEKAMGDWNPPRQELPPVPKVTNVPKPGIYCFHKEGRNMTQGRVTIEDLGITFWDPDSITLRVLAFILGGGGFSARLTQKVRSEMGLTYDIGADFRPTVTYRGWLRIGFQSKNESCALALKATLAEVERIRREPVTEEELAAAKRYFVDAFPAWFSTGAEKAGTFAVAEMRKIPMDYYHRYRDRVQAVTREDVQRVAKELLRPERFVIVVVGDIPALKEGNKEAKLAELGYPIEDVPLPDPVTLERPGK